MILTNKLSKAFHYLTLSSFLLPFFYDGCGPDAGGQPYGPGFGPSPEEKFAMEKAKSDSILAIKKDSLETFKFVIINNTDDTNAEDEKVKWISNENIINDYVSNSKQIYTKIENNSGYDSDDKTGLSQRLSKRFPFIAPILISREYTRTGLGMVIDTVPYLSIFSIFIALLLICISLLIKFIEKSAQVTIVILELISLIALFITQPVYFITYAKLWGFWVATTLACILVIYDLFVIIMNKKKVNRKQIKESSP